METYKLISTIDRDDDLSILKPIPCYYIVGKFIRPYKSPFSDEPR